MSQGPFAIEGHRAWIWGAGPKGAPAIAECERVMRLSPGTINANQRQRIAAGDGSLFEDLASGAVFRTRYYRGCTATGSSTLSFGARSLREMTAGAVTRARERNTMLAEVAFEDHGIAGPTPPSGVPETFLFFGRDGVTLNNLRAFQGNFHLLRQALAPGAAISLLHCYAFADRGRLAIAISDIVGCPVRGMDGLQTTNDQRPQGPVYEAYRGTVRLTTLSNWAVNFD